MTIAERNALVEANIGLAYDCAKRFRWLELDDAVQEALLAMLHAAELYDPTDGHCKFSTYAWRSMAHRLINLTVLRCRPIRPDADDLRPAHEAPPPLIDPVPAAIARRVHTLLDELPDRDAVVVRCHALGLSNGEIGRLLRVTRERVRQLLNRSIETLRDLAASAESAA